MAPYELPGSEALGENIAREFEKGVNIVMLENHGVCIGASDMFTAFMMFETLEYTANLEKLAREGDPTRYRFHSAFNEGDGFDFSFSGIKTAVVNRLHNAEQAGETVNRADLAASFQKTVVDILAEKSVRAAKAQAGEAGRKLALAGGVSANRALREAMEQRAAAAGVAFFCPDFAFCTDNAAMVGSAAYGKLLRGQTDSFALNAVPYLSIEESLEKTK